MIRIAMVLAMMVGPGAAQGDQPGANVAWPAAPPASQAVLHKEAADASALAPSNPAASAAASAAMPTPASAPRFVRKPNLPNPLMPNGLTRWLRVPRVFDHLRAGDVGLVINTADPYSVEVGQYYQKARKLKNSQVLRVNVPARGVINLTEFETLQAQINQHFGPQTQALVLAWTVPYAVHCNSITGALALGFDAHVCDQGCDKTRASPYFNSPSAKPFKDHGLRISMLLASANVAQAKALIDRGVASDGQLGLKGAPAANAYFVTTPDTARSVRSAFFPPPVTVQPIDVKVNLENTASLVDKDRVVMVQTGAAKLTDLETLHWLNGALADHLTSYGGVLDHDSGQTSALAWLTAGATASYGSVSEPCNHVQKFPHPQALLLHYVQGETAIEAYWKSVLWPQQGVFIGEPLAAPFARR